MIYGFPPGTRELADARLLKQLEDKMLNAAKNGEFDWANPHIITGNKNSKIFYCSVCGADRCELIDSEEISVKII